jgi:hypothetical protein
MLKKLSKEQKEILQMVKKDILNKAFDLSDINKDICQQYIDFMYSKILKRKPKKTNTRIIYVNSPYAVQQTLNYYVSLKSKILSKIKNKPLNEVRNEVSNEVRNENKIMFWIPYYTDSSNYGWVSFYRYFQEIGVLKNKKFKEYSNLFLESNIYQAAFLKNFTIVCRKPISLLRDSQKRLHSYDFPAIEWADGYNQYFVKGINVSKHWIGFDKKVTLKDIDSEQNTEKRRIALEIYGFKNYIYDKKAKCISSDIFGELYKIEFKDDEPLVMVSMLNSTPEPEYMLGLEGRQEFRESEKKIDNQFYKRYMIRVPPDMKTAKQALAWSAGVTEEEYELSFES